MKRQELELIRSNVRAGSRKHKNVFLNKIEPVINKIADKDGRNTPSAQRRKRMMKRMALEMLYTGYCPEKESEEGFLIKFFSEVYSSH